MEKDTKPQNDNRQNASQENAGGNAKNPFENHQSVEADVEQSQEALEKEQQFKEAMTERD